MTELIKRAGEEKTLPRHVAVIMDGNGRWAKERGLPRTAGHKVGAETFRTITKYCQRLGIEYLTVYAFSTENWKRPVEEVRVIMGLLEKYLLESVEKMATEKIRLKILGYVPELPDRVRRLIDETDRIGATLSDCLQANVCVNYGGRDEIVRAARAYAEEYARTGAPLTEELFSKYLYTADIPDPDLVIRPSGELRLSNFLPWQSAYSELYFTDVLWPDFDEAEFDRALESYLRRDRRFGGIRT